MKILEVVISITIIFLLAGLVTGALGGLRGADALVSSSETVLSALTTARTDTLASRGGNQYGVHFASTSITIFPGATWSAALTGTTTYALVPGTVVSATKLQGGPQVVDVVFDKLTGKTSEYGTTTLKVTVTGATSTVIVQSTGSISSASR